MLMKFADCIPPLSSTLYKGQSGRIGIIGGSKLYTGAPYYAAMTSLRLGADLAFVFCEPEAATPIKCYSPELIVHPTNGPEISDQFSRMHSILIGPGCGREPSTISNILAHIPQIRSLNVPLVIDADGLFAILKDIDVIRGFCNLVLTPNAIEFARLCDVVGIECGDKDTASLAKKLSSLLGNVTVVVKGEKDVITNGEQTVTCDREGSLRRTGGQGDVLAGTVATFMAWAHLKALKDGDIRSLDTLSTCFAACSVVRIASKLAFDEHLRSVVCTDVMKRVPEAFNKAFNV